ncbi:hypothetical protein BH20VER3_BH20VER3_12870 [soil metagenome]
MVMSDGDLMPFNLNGLANQPQSQPGKVINPADFFLAGDVRANEHSGAFAEMTSNLDFQARLASAYSAPDDVDAWVGGLVEDHVNGGQFGETFFAIIKDQFTRTRDGDRFWYESYLDAATIATVQQQTLGAIIKRNTPIGSEMQDDVFHVSP